MTEPMNPKFSREIENQLDAVYNSASPDPAFAIRLERQLTERAAAMQNPADRPQAAWLEWLRGIFRQPALAVPLAVILLLVLAVSLVGPQKVLAQVQRLLGYAPGIGFVEPGETRVLLAPVEQRQGDVVLRVENVVADSQQTHIVLQVTGLPREKFDMKSAAGDVPEEVKPYLLLPDGSRFAPGSSMSGIGDVLQASFSFPPLPVAVDQVTLVLPRLPSLPAGFAPENWSVLLVLQNTHSAETASAAGLSLTQPYTPAGAAAAAHGITASLLQVGQNPKETGLQAQISWENPNWNSLRDVQVQLADETGRRYTRHISDLGAAFEPGEPVREANARTTTYRFDPLDPQAKTGVLIFEQLTFGFTSDAKLRFDPGQNGSASQTWELPQGPGTQLSVAGVLVQPLSFTITPNPNPGTNPEDRYLLTLLVQTMPQDGLAIDSLFLSQFSDRVVSANCKTLSNSRLQLTIGLPEFPQQSMQLYLSSGEISITGPWKMEWKIPNQP
ncbi:MAG: hypothetical protein PHQ40_06845 [Anaerolineaceae bacterium]|nr:hypothetical protein [Anaerolineaceae bacterium]